MQEQNSIKVLEELGTGKFCNVGLPLTNSMVDNVTAVYFGKDKDGRYNFYDGGGVIRTFKMTKDFIIKRDIRITKLNNQERESILYKMLRKQEIRDKHKNKESR